MKKSNKILMILGIITCLTIIGTCIYLVYNVATNEKNDITESNKNNDVNEQVEETNTDTKEQELEVTEEDRILANNLLKPFNRYKDALSYKKMGYIYKYDKLTSENLPNDIILEVSLYEYVRENNDIYDNYYSVTFKSTNIDASVFKQTVQSIFGNVSYTNENISKSCTYGSAVYNADQNNYTYTGQGCGGTFLPYIESKIIQIKKYNDRIEIIERIAYIEYLTYEDGSTPNQLVYNNPTDKRYVGADPTSSSVDIFDKYSDKLTSYKWTFKKNESNYYFDKIEKLN